MSESSQQPLIPDQRPRAAVFSNPAGGPSLERRRRRGTVWNWIVPPGGVDPVELRSVRRPNLATASLRVGAFRACVDLWYVDLDAGAGAASSFSRCLSSDELAKSERFRSDVARTRYIVGRAALRGVLADRLGCSPGAVRLSYGAHGKPMLEGGRRRIEFNLAHSEGDAVIALASGAVVGVDLELRRPISGVESLARLVFSDEELRELELAPDPVSAFLNGWTRKEAYVKALGLGLAAPLTDITVSLSEKATLVRTGLRGQSVSDWRLLNAPHPRALVALALGPVPEGARTMWT